MKLLIAFQSLVCHLGVCRTPVVFVMLLIVCLIRLDFYSSVQLLLSLMSLINQPVHFVLADYNVIYRVLLVLIGLRRDTPIDIVL